VDGGGQPQVMADFRQTAGEVNVQSMVKVSQPGTSRKINSATEGRASIIWDRL